MSEMPWNLSAEFCGFGVLIFAGTCQIQLSLMCKTHLWFRSCLTPDCSKKTQKLKKSTQTPDSHVTLHKLASYVI